MTLSTSRQQFLASEAREGGLQYERKGGWFVTKCICCLFIAIAVLVAVMTGIAAFYLGREKSLFQSRNSIWSDVDSTAETAVTPNLRLPKTVMPSFYRLKLIPNLHQSIFTGEVYITLKTNESNVRNIILHSRSLNIHKGVTVTEQVYENIQNGRSKREVSATTLKNTNATTEPNHLTTESQKEVNKTDEDVTKLDKRNAETTTPTYTITPFHKTQTTQVTRSTIRKIVVSKFETDPLTDRLIVHLESPLNVNTDYTLEISFDGNITDSLTGFYKSGYIDANKQNKVLGITQFESVSARRAFPCFDEPQFKAMFEISIAHPNNITALSNMPVSAKEPMNDTPEWSWSHFDRTVKMSTYLVAFAIMDFDYLETSYLSKDNLTKSIKVWMRPELKHQAEYALSIAPKLLMFYEEWFGMPYTLPKMDLLAIPDFSTGAMENWGLCTFRETGLLYEEKSAARREKQMVAVYVAHELAHQWFGNLVTMEWWTDLWLNEGFASYMEYVGVDHLHPEWRMLDRFTRDKMDLLRTDALRHTTPVSMAVGDASDIAQKFDEIAYKKGASLLRMLNHTVTQKLWHEGLVAYLEEWKFSNAKESDLWVSMSAAAAEEPALQGISVVKFMESWTRQPGFPVVTATGDNGTGRVTFTQTLFTTVPSSRCHPIWYIPISYAVIDANATSSTSSGTWQTAPKLWLKERETSASVPLKADQALYVNIESIGYYRVNYDTRNWQLLTHVLDTNAASLTPLARAQLLDDAFNLAKVSLVPYRIALDLTVYLTKEETRTVWNTVFSNLAFIKFALRSTPYYSDFQDYVLQLIQPMLKKYNYGQAVPRNDEEALLIEILLYWECGSGGKRCISWAQKLFAEWMNNADYHDNPIPSDLRAVVYSEAVRYGGRAEFDFLWRVFRNSTDPSVQTLAVRMLPITRDDSLIRLLLERSLTDVPPQHVDSVWNVDSSSGARISEDFFIDNWLRLYDKFSKMDTFVLSRVVTAAFGAIMSEEDLDKFKKFVEDHYKELKPYRQDILKNVDSATLRIGWIKTHAAAIGDWLRQFKAKRAATTDKTPSDAASTVAVGTPRSTNVTQTNAKDSAANVN